MIAFPSLPRFDHMCFILLQELADHTAEVNVQHETLDETFTFYDSISGRLHVYQVCKTIPSSVSLPLLPVQYSCVSANYNTFHH